jgi:hypothetical protein
VPLWLPLLQMCQANVVKCNGCLVINIPKLWFLTAMAIRYVVLAVMQPLTYKLYRLISLLVTISGPPLMFFSIQTLQTSSLLGCEARPLFCIATKSSAWYYGHCTCCHLSCSHSVDSSLSSIQMPTWVRSIADASVCRKCSAQCKEINCYWR